MKYYIHTIEQITKDGEISEYSKSEKVDDYSTALSKYYKKLSDVSADLGKNHTYMNISIMNSTGNVLKKDEVGAYREYVATATEVSLPVAETQADA